MSRAGGRVVLVVLLAGLAQSAVAGPLALRLGPPSLGRGGTNPLQIPPTTQDVQLAYATDEGFEISVSVSPGPLLLGQRFATKAGFYASVGSGLIVNANGVGPGLYHSFGYAPDCGRTVCFTMEYQAALAASLTGGSGLIAPYAVRMGVQGWL